MNELIPCPFCGGEARTKEHTDMAMIGEPPWLVTCNSCLAESGVYHSEAEATTAWNTRATSHD